MSHWLKRLKDRLDPSREVPTHDELVLQFKEVYNQNRDYIRNVIFGLVRDGAVDDLVQETFYKAWRSYKKFQRGSTERTWLYRIARNAAYDYLRSRKNSLPLNEELDVDSSSTPGDDVVLRSLINMAMMELTPKHREVFMLYYKMGHTMPEISKLIRVSEGTVKSRLYYAREVFTHYLKANGVSDE